MDALRAFFGPFDIWQVLSSFIFLIAIIDPFGNIPITIAMETRGIRIHAGKVCIASLVILMSFLFLGEWMLKLFGVQIEYFAIAGGFVIFLMALEMYAGPGAFTALLAITAEYSTGNLCIALLLCMLVLYLVLIGTNWLTKYLGTTALYIIRKFFGIIVLAISCKLMFGNLATVF